MGFDAGSFAAARPVAGAAEGDGSESGGERAQRLTAYSLIRRDAVLVMAAAPA